MKIAVESFGGTNEALSQISYDEFAIIGLGA